MGFLAAWNRVKNSLPADFRSIGGIFRVYTLYAGLGLWLIVILAGCGQPPDTAISPGTVPRAERVVLPTQAPTVAPSPVNTRVMPREDVTPFPTTPLTPTITPIPDEVRGLVVEVLAGDTVSVVMEGDPPSRTYQVKYLGIEAPPNAPDTPWGTVAYEANRKMTNLKVVRLVRDQTETDAEGRLLRYVYLGDELLSIILVEQGLARANIIEPDTRFRAEIEEAEARARAGRLGLWGPPPTPTQPRTQSATSGGETTTEPTTPPPPAGTVTVAPVVASDTPTEMSSANENEGTSATATATVSSTPPIEPSPSSTSGRATDSSELQGP